MHPFQKDFDGAEESFLGFRVGEDAQPALNVFSGDVFPRLPPDGFAESSEHGTVAFQRDRAEVGVGEVGVEVVLVRFSERNSGAPNGGVGSPPLLTFHLPILLCEHLSSAQASTDITLASI